MEFSIDFFIFLAIAIIAIVLIIRFLKKVIKKILIATVVFVFGLYSLFATGIYDFNDVNIKNVEYNFSIEDLQNKFCKEDMNYRDSIKCYVIISPICEDIIKNYSQKELKQMEWNKYKMFIALKKTIKEKQNNIHENLKETNTLYIWNDFINDIEIGTFLNK